MKKLSIKEIQSLELDIIRAFDCFAKEQHLRWYLAGGTLIGAVRHQGFIPWDDDIDIMMPREDYEKMLKTFRHERYRLSECRKSSEAAIPFAQIYDSQTFLKWKKVKDPDLGVFIDIFPIDFCPDGKLLRTIKGVECNGIVFLSSSRDFREFCTPEIREGLLKTPKGTVNYFLRQAAAGLSRPLPIDSLFNLADKAARGRGRTDFCTSAMGRWHYLGEMQKTSTFLPLKRSEFCGKRAWTLHDEDAYLRHNYGPDYMEIPPKSKQEMHFIKKISL